jgi:hypothetical protein
MATQHLAETLKSKLLVDDPASEGKCCCGVVAVEGSKFQNLTHRPWSLPKCVFELVRQLRHACSQAHPVFGLAEHRADLGLVLVEEHALGPGHDLRLLDWVEILSLEILLRADREHLRVAHLTHDHWEHTGLPALLAHKPPRCPTSVAVDELEDPLPAFFCIPVRADDQHALEAGRGHPLGEF